jgi:hypothetical protein
MPSVISESEYEEKSSAEAEGEGQPTQSEPQGDPNVLQGQSVEPEATGDPFGGMFPEGVDTLEGEIEMLADGSFAGQGSEAEGEDTNTAGEQADDKSDADTGTSDSEEGHADWLSEVNEKTGLAADNKDEFVNEVRRLKTEREGIEQFDQLLDEAPELAGLIEQVANGTDIHRAVDEVLEGVSMSAPDPAEDPDAYADWKAEKKQRQKERRKRQKQRKQERENIQKMRRQMEQHFESFADRRDLEGDEKERFREKFVETFYGDPEEGRIRPDVFDHAYRAFKHDEIVEQEREEARKEGYNQAIREMQGDQKKEGDSLPNLISAGSGADDASSDRTPQGEGAEVMKFFGIGDTQDDLHDKF